MLALPFLCHLEFFPFTAAGPGQSAGWMHLRVRAMGAKCYSVSDPCTVFIILSSLVNTGPSHAPAEQKTPFKFYETDQFGVLYNKVAPAQGETMVMEASIGALSSRERAYAASTGAQGAYKTSDYSEELMVKLLLQLCQWL